MRRYEWSRLNGQQLGKYAEYFVMMEFTMYGWQVYATEVDDRGIDFVVRTEGGNFYEVQVKSVRKCNYIFLPKDKFPLKKSLIAAIVLFDEGAPPSLYLIPSLAWNATTELLCGRDYDGKKSKPEWGVNISAKNRPMLDAYRFDQVIPTLAANG